MIVIPPNKEPHSLQSCKVCWDAHYAGKGADKPKSEGSKP